MQSRGAKILAGGPDAEQGGQDFGRGRPDAEQGAKILAGGPGPPAPPPRTLRAWPLS